MKTLYFEYIISLLIQWYEEECPGLKGSALSSFTRLKSLKLLFLISAIDATPKKEENGLLDIFDKFYAMQHGPVEGDVYDAMVKNTTQYYEFGGKNTTLKNIDTDFFAAINDDIKNRLEDAVLSLKKKNPKIVTYNPFALVDITHKWTSWQIAYKVAQLVGKGSEKMSSESIKDDNKYFN